MVYVNEDSDGKKYFKFPVEWKLFSHVAIRADSLDEAIAYFAKNSEDIPIEDDAEYVDESYTITGMDYHDTGNPAKIKAALEEQYGEIESWDAD